MVRMFWWRRVVAVERRNTIGPDIDKTSEAHGVPGLKGNTHQEAVAVIDIGQRPTGDGLSCREAVEVGGVGVQVDRDNART